MGGEGSGRKPDMAKRILNQSKFNPTINPNLVSSGQEPIIIPNYSGVKHHVQTNASFDDKYVLKSGDTMLGNLTFSGGADLILGAGTSFQHASNMDFYPTNQTTIGLRLASDGTNLELTGLGTSFIELKDSLDMDNNSIVGVETFDIETSTGTPSVRFSSDQDGRLVIAGLTGNLESVNVDFDNINNVIDITSSSGATTLRFISINFDGNGLRRVGNTGNKLDLSANNRNSLEVANIEYFTSDGTGAQKLAQINKNQDDIDFEIYWDNGLAFIVDGATGNVTFNKEVKGTKEIFVCSLAGSFAGTTNYLNLAGGLTMSSTIGVPMNRAGSITAVTLSMTVTGTPTDDCDVNIGGIVSPNFIPLSTGRYTETVTYARGTNTFSQDAVLYVNLDHNSSGDTFADPVVTIEVMYNA